MNFYSNGSPTPSVDIRSHPVLNTFPQSLVNVMLTRGKFIEMNDFATANAIAGEYARRRGDEELANYLDTDKFVLLSFDMMNRDLRNRKRRNQ
jgi:hypothetical protein